MWRLKKLSVILKWLWRPAKPREYESASVCRKRMIRRVDANEKGHVPAQHTITVGLQAQQQHENGRSVSCGPICRNLQATF